MNKETLKQKFPYLYRLYQKNSFFKATVQRLLQSKPLSGVDVSKKFDGKIFCIGANKTGTTSVEHALRSFGYKMGEQARAEMLDDECFEGKFDRLIRFCALYDAFQDVPFSKGDYYQALDTAFPNSKFILTIRDSSEQWFNSVCKFHSKIYGQANSLPSEDDLKNSRYGYLGMAYDNYRKYYNYPETPLYDKDKYIEIYEKRNASIIKYFRDKEDQLLVLNVGEEDAYQSLGDFLNIKLLKKCKFPHENKT